MTDHDVIDLTTDATAGYDPTALLENDPQLRGLQANLATAQARTAECAAALSTARHRLHQVENAVAERRATLLTQAEAKIDWVGRAFPWDKILQETLTKVFGIRAFRPLQREAINAAMSRRDVFAVLPTGAGKSLLYQAAALVDGGLTLVVTPLVALMQDQTAQLARLNVNAYMMDASSSKEDVARIFNDVLPPASKYGATKLSRSNRQTAGFDVTKWEPRQSSACILFVTPERVTKSKKFQSRLELAYEQGRISRFCFDEAHCISQWGHDFRHDYAQMGILRTHFRQVPIMALTATATLDVVEDVKKSLDIEPVVLRGSIDRPNLFYEVRQKPDDLATAIAKVCLEECPRQTGIVYVLSRKDAERTAEALAKLGVACRPYHGDLSDYDRKTTFASWSVGKLRVVVATIAFGLGVNKLDCRFVIHSCVASSLIGLYQESGRAGRDGKPAKCILYWHPSDLVRMSSFVSDKGTNRLKMLYESCRYAVARPRSLPMAGKRPRLQQQCRRAMIAAAFGEDPPMKRGRCCDLCQSRGERNATDMTQQAQSALRILRLYSARFPDDKLTLNSMATDWANSGPKGNKLRGNNEPVTKLDKGDRLEILAQMVLEDVIEEYHVFGAYSSQGYIREGPKSRALEEGQLTFTIRGGK